MEEDELMEETEDMMSYAFAWEEHIWDYFWPEYTGLPSIVFVDSYRENDSSTPLVMFCPWKNPTIEQKNRRFGIPMVICDNPYIPDKYKHRKHELSDNELNQIKEWVVKYKDILMLTKVYVETELEKAGANEAEIGRKHE